MTVADLRSTPGVRIALTIAGSDSGGGAGIQADLKTFAALGVFGASAVTAITAQNTRGVQRSVMLDPDLIEAQIDSVASDFNLHAVKTGMLGTVAAIETVVAAIGRHRLFPLVVDPVMVAKGGDPLIDDAAVRTLARKLLPLASVATPNTREAARMLGLASPIIDVFAATEAARRICGQFGAQACVVKGLRRAGPDGTLEAVDLFFDGQTAHELTAPWRESRSTHGSGCTFSAAIAGNLALGHDLAQAMTTAKAFVAEAIHRGTGIGQGVSPVNHLAWLSLRR